MKARLRHLRHRDLDGIPRDRLTHLEKALALANDEGRLDYFTFTAANLTNLITVAGQDDLGMKRAIVTGDDLPAGLEAGTLYFLGDKGTNLYSLHLTKADAAGDANAVEFTDDGTGTLTLTVL